MTVTVDRQPIQIEPLGLRTIGQLLSHIRKANRLVVHMLIDGHEPDPDQIGTVRQSPLVGHTVYVETAEPRQMASDILTEVQSQLDEADRMKTEAAEQLQANNTVKAMEKLAGCFTTWSHAQESIAGTARLMGIDLDTIKVNGQGINELFESFAGTLREIKSALENRDFVNLTDLLMYETTQSTDLWRKSIQSLRDAM